MTTPVARGLAAAIAPCLGWLLCCPPPLAAEEPGMGPPCVKLQRCTVAGQDRALCFFADGSAAVLRLD